MNLVLPTRRGLLAAMACVPFVPFASALAARPTRDALPLLLAQDAPTAVDPAGYLVSEKYDGVRALWDGQRLRFRSGLPVPAPAWFLQRLPALALDGELWLGRGRFDDLSGAVRRQLPDDGEWRQIRYMVFEMPAAGGTFAERALQLSTLVQERALPGLQAVAQATVTGRAALQRRLDDVVARGGEGLMLHRADAPVLTGRQSALLKLKPVQDADAVVVGHSAGRGRHTGRLGALHVRGQDGRQFLVGTGLTDAQRASPPAAGTWITYTYRGLTDNGLPRFASFLRVRDL
jgi:DNA ligase-1